jgi:hypothetical protein
MGQIYSKAERVLVWLGEELDIRQNALRLFSFIHSNPQINQLKAEVQQYFHSNSGELHFDEGPPDAVKAEAAPQRNTPASFHYTTHAFPGYAYPGTGARRN